MKKEKPNPQDLFELGEFYLLNQKFSEAINKFKAALKLKPDDPQMYFQLGLAYEGACFINEAKEMFRKTLELDGSSKEAAEHLDRLTDE
jgi:tetratricopeptide (TPR) repeat protein